MFFPLCRTGVSEIVSRIRFKPHPLSDFIKGSFFLLIGQRFLAAQDKALALKRREMLYQFVRKRDCPRMARNARIRRFSAEQPQAGPACRKSLSQRRCLRLAEASQRGSAFVYGQVFRNRGRKKRNSPLSLMTVNKQQNKHHRPYRPCNQTAHSLVLCIDDDARNERQ